MSPRLATIATQFLERPGIAKSTIRSYESTLTPLLVEYGGWPVEILDRATLETYLHSLTHLSHTTHQKHQATLQALFNYAVEQGYLKANPIAGLKRRKPNPEQGEHGTDEVVRYFTPQQLQLLYQAVEPDVRISALVQLLHRSGARISEILQLDLARVDFVQQRFQVIGKGNKQRWCFYGKDAAVVLAEYVRLYRHEGNEPALFTAQHPSTLKVSRLSYRTVHQRWGQLIKPFPELLGARLHDLRHTFATERVGLMGIEELRALMGHQNIQTTLRYQKVTSRRAEEVAKNALIRLTNSESE